MAILTCACYTCCDIGATCRHRPSVSTRSMPLNFGSVMGLHAGQCHQVRVVRGPDTKDVLDDRTCNGDITTEHPSNGVAPDN